MQKLSNFPQGYITAQAGAKIVWIPGDLDPYIHLNVIVPPYQ